ncbi:MAG TPA: hypothetical protein VJ836_07430 [Candidatus Saccharimonadales bacterium]|nr:hypothetical protein [Candidatus Saccharimonadales bacterium]
MPEFHVNSESATQDNSRLASPWHNVYSSFLLSQGDPRLQGDFMFVYAAVNPDGFKAMYGTYFSTDESKLTEIDTRLRPPYSNDLAHPGRVKESEYRQRGANTLAGALGNAALLVEDGSNIQLELWLPRLAVKMADKDAFYLNRAERRNKPGSRVYTLLRANSASHLFHYMFLDEHANYPQGSIMHIALDAAAALRSQIEDGTIASDSKIWSACCKAFGVHLQAYPEHIPQVSGAFLAFIDSAGIKL